MTWLFAIGRFLKGVPWQVWAALALAVVVWRGIAWHEATVADALKQADKSGYDRAMGEVRERQNRITLAALMLKPLAMERQTAINQEVGNDNAKASDAIRSSADALRVRWDAEAKARPAASIACGTAIPGSAAGAESRPGAGDDRLALVPRAELIARAERCDLTTKALASYEDWYVKQRAAYDDWRKRYDEALRKP